jgi:23S rRNA pseudouridine1911/1915/1917 synthase
MKAPRPPLRNCPDEFSRVDRLWSKKRRLGPRAVHRGDPEDRVRWAPGDHRVQVDHRPDRVALEVAPVDLLGQAALADLLGQAALQEVVREVPLVPEALGHPEVSAARHRPRGPRRRQANAVAIVPKRRSPRARRRRTKKEGIGAGTEASTRISPAPAVGPAGGASSDVVAATDDDDGGLTGHRNVDLLGDDDAGVTGRRNVDLAGDGDGDPASEIDLTVAVEVEVDPPGDGDARNVIRLRIPVPRECDGWRLDHFLKRRIGRLSRTRIQEIIGTQITLEGGRRSRPSAAVHFGETIFLERPAPKEPDVPRRFDVLYEDESVLVIDKPAGLPMHTSAKFWRNTLVAVLRERYPGQHTEICHRIDRETSGVMLVARTPQAGAFLKTAFAHRTIAKRYLALCKGIPPDEGVIDQPIKLLESPTHLMMGPSADGLPAVTRFRVVRRFAAHALVAASPETGRQHQIRVHLAALGYPLVGDKLYGAGEQYFMEACDRGISAELLARFDGLPRHALHAETLTFPHPVTAQPVTVVSPLPADLTDYMAGLL